jgi:hypothetical protein
MIDPPGNPKLSAIKSSVILVSTYCLKNPPAERQRKVGDFEGSTATSPELAEKLRKLVEELLEEKFVV